jgi:hypothetical protein
MSRGMAPPARAAIDGQPEVKERKSTRRLRTKKISTPYAPLKNARTACGYWPNGFRGIHSGNAQAAVEAVDDAR